MWALSSPALRSAPAAILLTVEKFLKELNRPVTQPLISSAREKTAASLKLMQPRGSFLRPYVTAQSQVLPWIMGWQIEVHFSSRLPLFQQ